MPTPVPPNSPLPPLPREWRRGLRRSALAAAGVACLAVALALAVAWKAGGERRRVHESLLARARAEMAGREPGHTARALAAVREAAALRPTAPLRDVATQALASADLIEREFSPVLREEGEAVSLSASGRFFSRQQGRDGLEICALPDGRRQAVIAGLGEEPHLAVANEDDSLLAIRLASGALRVFTTPADGLPVETFRAEHRRVLTSRHSLAFVPGRGDVVVMADQARRVISLRRVGPGSRSEPDLARWEMDSTPGAVAVSADGKKIAAALDGGRVALAETPEPGANDSPPWAYFQVPSRATALAFRPQGGLLGGVCESGEAWLHDPATRATRWWPAHRGYANGALFHPGGNWLVTTGWDGRTCVWEGQTGHPLLSTRRGLAGAFRAGGAELVFYAGRQGYGCWEARTGAPFLTLLGVPPLARPECDDAALSPDGRRLAVANREGFGLFDVEEARRLAWVPRRDCRGAGFSPDGSRLLVTGAEGMAVWSRERGLETVLLQGAPMAPAWRLAQAQDARGSFAAASGAGAGWLLQWTEAGAVPLVRVAHDVFGPETRLALAPGQWRSAASLWKGGGAWLWEGPEAVAAGPRRIEPGGGSVAFSHDGRLMATGDNGGYRFRALTPREGGVIHQWPEAGGSDFPGDIAFDFQGRASLITGRGGITRLQPETGGIHQRLPGLLDAQLYKLHHDRAARRLAAATDMGFAAVWHLDPLAARLAALDLPPGPLPEAWEGGAFSSAPRWALLAAAAGLAMLCGLAWLHRRQSDALQRYEAARQALFQAEKMRALGVVSAGVAHDFRNLLSVISLNSGLLRRRFDDAPPGGPGEEAENRETATRETEEEFAAIAAAVRDGSAVIHSLLGFARDASPAADPEEGPAPEPACNAAVAIEAVIAMSGKSFLAGLRLHLHLEAGLPPVALPASALRQALLNLVLNAREAMSGGGDLTLTASRAATARTDGVRLLPAPAGPAVVVSVSDTGPGIAPADHHRVFEPFFTTKAQSARPGTGLGLHTVREIAALHHAGLVLRSAPAVGAAVILELPVARTPPPMPEPPSTAIPPA